MVAPKAHFEVKTHVNRMDSNPCYMAELGDVYGHSYKSEKDACAILAGKVVDLALKRQREENNYKRGIIMTNDPETIVLAISFRYDCWQYDIVRKGQANGGSCSGGAKTFDEIMEQARNHALGSYGGVAWEARF
jgi:predicted lactoylglutathione lyase